MDAARLYQRYQELQTYVLWTPDDARRVHSVSKQLEDHLVPIVDDFYEEIERHAKARAVITGGQVQIERLKGTLVQWLMELLNGPYETDFVMRRWKVGLRHVDIGLDQVYTNVALSRLRCGLKRALDGSWSGTSKDLLEVCRSLDKLIDLDLAIIEDAYQTEYRARQQRTERLAAIGQVAGGIAHELRNPLNVIKTSVYYLLNARNASPEKKAEHLQRIERHVSLADGVITVLSNFAKLPLPNMQPFSAMRCVQEAVETTIVPKSIQIQIECPIPLRPALADRDQLNIVFSNLVRNARDAMPQGGTLTIRGEEVGDQVEIVVADTGVGIPYDELHRIMEPLYSTKARGLGLGLAISRAILEKNKGSMRVASTVGQGSTFTVVLCIAKGEQTP